MRQAADELRAELAGDTVTFVVNRNINVSNVCIVGCAFCGFGQGRRSPDAYTHEREEFVARIARRRRVRGDRAVHPVRHPSRLGARGLRGLAAAGQGDGAAAPPARVLADGGRAHVRPLRAPAARGLRAAARRPGSARCPAPPPRCSTTACASGSARTSCRSRAGSRSSRPRTRAGLRSTVTVMFGHIEEPHELAEHMRVVRALQERTGGFTEFVPLSFIPFHTLLGPHARDRGDLARGEPQAHRGVPAGARAHDPEPAGELGEDGARRRHRGAALGRQRPRRHADGGVDLAPRGLLPRRQARPGGPRRGRAPRRPPGGRAHDAVRLRRRYPLVAAAA